MKAWGLLALFALTGCTTFSPVDQVNYDVNRYAGCGSPRAGTCHPVWPTRAELAQAVRLECTGYVMAKAYRLIAQEIAPGRLTVATFSTGRENHAVLVLDQALVLDNQSDSVRALHEYAQFNLALFPLPARTQVSPR